MKVAVTREHIFDLVVSRAFELGRGDLEPLEEWEHDIVLTEMELLTELAKEIALDLEAEIVAPYCAEETSIAAIFRRRAAEIIVPLDGEAALEEYLRFGVRGPRLRLVR